MASSKGIHIRSHLGWFAQMVCSITATQGTDTDPSTNKVLILHNNASDGSILSVYGFAPGFTTLYLAGIYFQGTVGTLVATGQRNNSLGAVAPGQFYFNDYGAAHPSGTPSFELATDVTSTIFSDFPMFSLYPGWSAILDNESETPKISIGFWYLMEQHIGGPPR